MHNHCTPLISLSVVYATEKDRYGTVMTAVCNVLQPPSWSILLTSWKRVNRQISHSGV
jgi:hypothetical protein